jgi:membrane protease YdiL (CAAX protease family)
MAGARVETQLQLTIAVVAERRGTVFLLLGMLAWIAIAFAGAGVAAAVVGSAVGVARGLRGPAAIGPPPQVFYVLVAAWGFQGTLLLGALRQGRLAGSGDRSLGLGAGPLRRQGLVTLLCAAIIGWLACFILLMETFPALREYAKSVTPDVLSGVGDDGAAAALLRVMLIVFLAPVSEELFFRGWLWEALRRRGHAAAVTASLTAIPWLLLHGIDAPGRILFLIPAAVIFSTARHMGGGVRASLAVHITNNLAAMMMQELTALFGHGE